MELTLHRAMCTATKFMVVCVDRTEAARREERSECSADVAAPRDDSLLARVLPARELASQCVGVTGSYGTNCFKSTRHYPVAGPG